MLKSTSHLKVKQDFKPAQLPGDPVPLHPVSHVHSNEPRLLVQFALLSHVVLSAHSSISENKYVSLLKRVNRFVFNCFSNNKCIDSERSVFFCKAQLCLLNFYMCLKLFVYIFLYCVSNQSFLLFNLNVWFYSMLFFSFKNIN